MNNQNTNKKYPDIFTTDQIRISPDKCKPTVKLTDKGEIVEVKMQNRENRRQRRR